MLKQTALICSLITATAFAAPQNISYYLSHTQGKLPSTDIGYVFNLAKFNNATLTRTRTTNDTHQTTSAGSSLINLTIANATGENVAVYVQEDTTLDNIPPSAFCTVQANSNNTVYAHCSGVLQAVTGSTYSIYAVPFASSSDQSQVEQELSNNALFTQASSCRLSSDLGSGATLLSNNAVQVSAASSHLLKILNGSQCSVA